MLAWTLLGLILILVVSGILLAAYFAFDHGAERAYQSRAEANDRPDRRQAAGVLHLSP
jgi:hypothetical protein